MTRDRLDFLGALTWHISRVVALIIVTASLVSFLHGLEVRGERAMKEHEAVLKQQLEALKELETSRNDHRAIWQRLTR